MTKIGKDSNPVYIMYNVYEKSETEITKNILF